MSKELLNKSITSCFAKIARVDGSIGQEEKDIMNSSKILSKYKSEDIEEIDTKRIYYQVFLSDEHSAAWILKAF